MNLGGSWDYITSVAQSRLAHNKTSRHVSDYGDNIEVIGAAGELLARRYFGLEEKLHDGFDGGHDFLYAGKTVDVKATILTPQIQHRYLQWPTWKRIKAEIILLTAVDPLTRQGIVIGWATGDEILRAKINNERSTPCYEIPIPALHPVYELFAIAMKEAQRW